MEGSSSDTNKETHSVNKLCKIFIVVLFFVVPESSDRYNMDYNTSRTS